MPKIEQRIIILLAFIILIGFFILGPQPAEALISVSLRPVKFILEIEQGQNYEDSIMVINNSEEELTLKSELQDFIPRGEAAIDFVPRAGPGTSLVDWIDIIKEPFTLQPKEEKNIPFTIRVPKEGVPGGHFAVLFFNALPKEQMPGSGVGITPRIGSLVMVSVPGDISKGGEILEFKGPNWLENGPIGFTIKFHNLGSVHYRPEGKLIIKNMFGRQVAEGTVDSQYVFPNTSRTMSGVVQSHQFFWGPQTAILEMKDGAGNPHYAYHKFWGLPWRVTVLPAIGIVILLIGFWQMKKRFKFTVVRKS